MYAGGKLWWGSTSVDGAVARRLWAIGKAGIMMECETTSQGENVKPPAELAPTMPTICFDSPHVLLGFFSDDINPTSSLLLSHVALYQIVQIFFFTFYTGWTQSAKATHFVPSPPTLCSQYEM